MKLLLEKRHAKEFSALILIEGFTCLLKESQH